MFLSVRSFASRLRCAQFNEIEETMDDVGSNIRSCAVAVHIDIRIYARVCCTKDMDLCDT